LGEIGNFLEYKQFQASFFFNDTSIKVERVKPAKHQIHEFELV